ncbi:hypothetical protein [Atopomonas sediminilitoris]|uniref:hypothetical protein n=1 Tax=Atopomonas sediminilitoris TaxID=2919919 RepID=UPI001F4DBC1B|nr:hypothetical protein [Atopomonas sediminilitoris]MCJ8168057.1 hypothetical protein [Atopomonas sediminilitoris]
MPTPYALHSVLFSLCGSLVDFGSHCRSHWQRHADHSALLGVAETQSKQLIAGAATCLQHLHQHDVRYAWVDDLPSAACRVLQQPLSDIAPQLAAPQANPDTRPWPAPDRLWQALSHIEAPALQGSVLVSSDPATLQAGLNAGLWCVGLAVSSQQIGLSEEQWQALPANQQDALRAQATLSLFKLGVHSVVDSVSELPVCLDDIAQRLSHGERP